MATITSAITNGSVVYLVTSGSPNSGGGTDANIGSIATDKNTGYLYTKIGSGLSDWMLLTINNPSYGLYAQTVLGTIITATTVETSLIGTGVGTLTVPANAFSVGDSFTAKMCGLLSCANAETLHIRVKSNGIVIIDAGVFTLNITTNKYFELMLDFTVTKLGIAGVAELFANGQFSYNKNANSNIEGNNFALIDNTLFDTTVTNTLTITAQWGSANALNSIQSQNFILTKVY